MKVEHKKINFKDKRGTIVDIFTNEPKDHATIIFSKKGSVRGNHYHKKSTQYTFVVSGQLTMLTQKVGQKKVHSCVLSPNDLAMHEPLEAHTFVADKDTVFLSFVNGLRGGANYEKDTFRLETSIEKK